MSEPNMSEPQSDHESQANEACDLSMEVENSADLTALARRSGPAGSPSYESRMVESISRIARNAVKPRRHGRFATVCSEDDIAQETLIKLHEWVVGTESTKTLSPAYVMKVSQNTMTDLLRQFLAKKRMPSGGLLEQLGTSSSDMLNDIGYQSKTPSQQMIIDERCSTACACVDGDDRVFLELRYQESLSNPEIADMFGLTPEAVRTRFSRILRKLRESLQSNSDFDSYR